MSLPDVKSESGMVDWQAILQKTLPNVDIFLPSVEEAFFIFDREEYFRVKAEAAGGDFTKFINMGKIMELGEKLICMGCAAVAIKCGARGIYLKTAGEKRIRQMGIDDAGKLRGWADIELFEESYKVEDFKSSLAAGDTAIAGFLSAFIKGLGAVDCAKTAAKTGALCCTAYDALSGILPFEKVQCHIEEHPEKIINNDLGAHFVYDKERCTWFAKKTK